MSDAFADHARRVTDPAVTIHEVTPDDATDLPFVATGLNVATPGTVRVTTVDGTTSDVNIAPGQLFPLRAQRVWLTGTTATGIRALG